MATASPIAAPLEAHPAALAFPMLSDERLAALAADIKAHGQQEPIVLFGGLLLDGRNRFAACGIAGVRPRFVTLAADECPSPTQYVLSKNLQRRDLTPVQRAALAVSPIILAAFKAEAKAKQHAAGERGHEGGRGNRKTLGTDDVQRVSAGNPRVSRAVVEAATAVSAGRDSAYAMQQVRNASPEVYERALAGEFKTVIDAKRAAGIPDTTRDLGGKQPGDHATTRQAVPAEEKLAPASHAIDGDVREMASAGHPSSEIARTLGVSPNAVSLSKKRLGLRGANPLSGPLAFVTEATDTLGTMHRSFKPQWSEASESQVDEVVESFEALIRAARSFIQRLKKEAKGQS